MLHEADELVCPVEHKEGYGILKAKFIAGDDVAPYLSKTLLSSKFEDMLLNDWGIHHFHLGEKMERSGLVNRTGPLLFAMVTPSDVYCIGVLPHGSWSQQDLVRTAHRNWPDMMSRYRVKGALGLARSISDEDVSLLRKGGVQTMVEVEKGVVYFPMGGGYSTAGTSVDAMMRANRYLDLMDDLEAYVRDNSRVFLEAILEKGGRPKDPPAFSLLVTETGFFAVESGAKMAFLLHAHV